MGERLYLVLWTLSSIGIFVLGLVLEAKSSHDGMAAGLVGGGAVGLGMNARAWFSKRPDNQRR